MSSFKAEHSDVSIGVLEPAPSLTEAGFVLERILRRAGRLLLCGRTRVEAAQISLVPTGGGVYGVVELSPGKQTAVDRPLDPDELPIVLAALWECARPGDKGPSAQATEALAAIELLGGLVTATTRWTPTSPG
jgi:hypothetical protein